MAETLQTKIEALDRQGLERTGRLVDLILAEAVRVAASDVHFEPTHTSLEVRYRLDGVLQKVAVLSRELSANVVARLKVMAELLTYRQDVPQEGRLAQGQAQFGVDMRVSTFPTIHGEKAAVRLFGAGAGILDLDQVGLPAPLQDELRGFSCNAPAPSSSPARPAAARRPPSTPVYAICTAKAREPGTSSPSRIPSNRCSKASARPRPAPAPNSISRAGCAACSARIRKSSWSAKCATPTPPTSSSRPP